MADDLLLDCLSTVCGYLESLGICHAITGSLASSLHGEPIASQDVDVCVQLSAEHAALLEGMLRPRFYCSHEAMVAAIRERSMVNLIDQETGFKVDLCNLPASPFFVSVFARRLKVAYGPGGPTFWVVTAEDVILMKLLWRKDTRSSKQWENALSVVRVQGARMDWRYLHDWAERLGLSDDLDRLKQEGGI